MKKWSKYTGTDFASMIHEQGSESRARSHTDANIDQPADARSFAQFRFDSSRPRWQRLAAERSVPQSPSQMSPSLGGRWVEHAPPSPLVLPHHGGSGSSSNLLGITFNSHAFAGVAG